MEIFVDGGLFEVIIAVLFGYAINYIFFKKYLLVVFSAGIILSPVALFFINPGELQKWLISFCILNASLLVVLLWKERVKTDSLFNVKKLLARLYRK